MSACLRCGYRKQTLTTCSASVKESSLAAAAVALKKKVTFLHVVSEYVRLGRQFSAALCEKSQNVKAAMETFLFKRESTTAMCRDKGDCSISVKRNRVCV